MNTRGKAAQCSRFSLDKHTAEAYESEKADRKSARYRLSPDFNWIYTTCPSPFLKAHFQSFSYSASFTKWLIVIQGAPSEHQVTGHRQKPKTKLNHGVQRDKQQCLMSRPDPTHIQTECNELRQSANVGSTAPAEGVNPSITVFCFAFFEPNPSLSIPCNNHSGFLLLSPSKANPNTDEPGNVTKAKHRLQGRGNVHQPEVQLSPFLLSLITRPLKTAPPCFEFHHSALCSTLPPVPGYLYLRAVFSPYSYLFC